MSDIQLKVKISSLNKEVLVPVLDSGDLSQNFNAASNFVKTLELNNQIRDLEAGVNPASATHEVVKDGEGNYRLQRFRMGGRGLF
jgi:hypothetical protein